MVLKPKNLFFYSLVATQILFARDYYVSTKGSDSNPGTLNEPFKTIQKAADIAIAGDRVYVREGTYTGTIRFKHSGSKEKGYIIFKNYKDEKPVITRKDTNYKTDTVRGDGVSYIKFEGFTLYKPIAQGIVFRDGGDHIEISDNEVYEQNAQVPDGQRIGHAITVTTTRDKPMTHIVIKGNNVHNNHTGNTDKGGNYDEALTILGNVQFFQVVDNKVYDNDFIGIDIIGHQKGNFSTFGMNKNGLVARNILHGNGKQKEYASSLYVDGALNLIVENNIIYDNHGYGLAVSQESEGSTTEHVIVRNNLILNSYEDGILFGATNGKVLHSVFVQNSVQNATKERLLMFGKGDNNTLLNNYFGSTNNNENFLFDINSLSYTWQTDNNAYYTTSGFYARIRNNSYRDFGSYQRGSGFDEKGFQTPDPKFKDKQLHLKKDSPLVDSGSFLTVTLNKGRSNVIKVKNADFFSDGFYVKKGDEIIVGKERVKVVKVDYNNNEITIDKTISWQNDTKISYLYTGKKPDIGWDEYAKNDTGNDDGDMSEAPDNPDDSHNDIDDPGEFTFQKVFDDLMKTGYLEGMSKEAQNEYVKEVLDNILSKNNNQPVFSPLPINEPQIIQPPKMETKPFFF